MEKTTLSALAGLAFLSAYPFKTSAQTQDSILNRTVVVEQEYNPIILDAEKINAVPRIEAPVAPQMEVEYDGRAMPARNIPAGYMPIYALAKAQAKATPGYLRLGYGNYGNLDVHADYQLHLTQKDFLGLTFRMDGMDGTLDIPGLTDKWNSYYYRTHASIGYRHDFSQVQMDLAGHFDLSNFNFLPGSTNSNQKFTAADFHIGVSSSSDELPLQFQAETNLMFYERQHELSFAHAQEVLVRTKAYVSGPISATQTIGVAAGMDNIFYTNNNYTDYTSLGLNPYYSFHNDTWEVRLGIHADLTFGFGSILDIAPDVQVSFRPNRICQLYVQAFGGELLNDFRRLERFNPYGQTIYQPSSTYEQLNTALGIKLGIPESYYIHLYGGYQNLKDDLYDVSTIGTGYANELSTWDTSNLYAAAEISYDYKGIVSLTAQGILRQWSAANNGEKLNVLAFKPAREGKIQLDAHPISALRLLAGYRSIIRKEYNGAKAKPVSDLYLGASYNVLKNLSVHIHADNLLNKDYQYYYGYPAEGLNILGGASIRF